MSEYTCLVFLLVHDGRLFRCAMKIHNDRITEDMHKYCLEPENKAKFRDMLPSHVPGDIVAVEEIFEVGIVEKTVEKTDD